MKDSWQSVKLGKILQRSEEKIEIQPEQTYREITIRLWGKGIVLRREVIGAEISAAIKFVVRSQQFALSRIDARNGAFGIVPDSLDRAIVSRDFPSYIMNESLVVPKFLEWMSKTAAFINLCKRASEGTTNRVRLQEERFLGSEILLPSLQEQRMIASQIETLAAKIAEANLLRKKAVVEAERLIEAKFKELWAEYNKETQILPLTQIVTQRRRPVVVEPEKQYSEIGIYSYGRGIFHKPPRLGFEVGNKDLYLIKQGDLILQVTFAWEGAIALAGSNEEGMFGSVRYLTFQVNENICDPRYLLMYLKTSDGIEQLGKISPGSAGRNRVLSKRRFIEVKVPVLPLRLQQLLMDKLFDKVEEIKRLQDETSTSLEILPNVILNKIYRRAP